MQLKILPDTFAWAVILIHSNFLLFFGKQVTVCISTPLFTCSRLHEETLPQIQKATHFTVVLSCSRQLVRFFLNLIYKIERGEMINCVFLFCRILLVQWWVPTHFWLSLLTVFINQVVQSVSFWHLEKKMFAETI